MRKKYLKGRKRKKIAKSIVALLMVAGMLATYAPVYAEETPNPMDETEVTDTSDPDAQGAVTEEYSQNPEEMIPQETPSQETLPQEIPPQEEDSSVNEIEPLANKNADSIIYRTHVQTHGWQGFVANGTMSGTSGEAKRLEGIEIKLENPSYSGGVRYRTHVQTHGWQDFVANGTMSGTSGEAKRLEAIQIELTGEMANHFDVYYRVHAQTFGWMGWAKNGDYAGTAGYAKRLEGIEIRLVAKGGNAPGNTENAYKHPLIQYQTHVQTYGWQVWKQDGAMSGTEGQAKRLEGINIALCNQDYTGSVRYRTHVQTYGWQDYVADGAMSGTSGKAKRLEAIQIELTGEMATHYDIYYRVHAQTFGWMGWAKNGGYSGTAGYAKRLEGIEIRLVTKGGNAPGSTENAYKEVASGDTNTGDLTHTHTWTALNNFVIKCNKCKDTYLEGSLDRELHNVADNCYGSYSVVRAPGRQCSVCGKYENTKHIHSWKPSRVEIVEKRVRCQCGAECRGYVNNSGKYVTAEENWRNHYLIGVSNGNGNKHATFTQTTGKYSFAIPTKKCSCGRVPNAFTQECNMYQNLVKGKEEIVDIIIDGKGGYQIEDIVAKSAK